MIRVRKSKKNRQHNDQKKKNRQHNDQKKKNRQHNDQKKKNRQHNDQKTEEQTTQWPKEKRHRKRSIKYYTEN